MPGVASLGRSALDHRFEHASALREEASPAGSSIRRAAVTGALRNTSRRRRPLNEAIQEKECLLV